MNAKHPAVPATLDLTLEDYFTSAALIGLLAAQELEPDREWVCKWTERLGQKMAVSARKRRRR